MPNFEGPRFHDSNSVTLGEPLGGRAEEAGDVNGSVAGSLRPADVAAGHRHESDTGEDDDNGSRRYDHGSSGHGSHRLP